MPVTEPLQSNAFSGVNRVKFINIHPCLSMGSEQLSTKRLLHTATTKATALF